MPKVRSNGAPNNQGELGANKVGNHFDALCLEFRKYHANSLNVFLHLVTTPGCLVACIAFINQYTGSVNTAVVLAALYVLSLALQLSRGLFVANAVCVAAIVYSSVLIPGETFGLWSMAALFGVCYVGQDLAHWLTGEITFQSTYMANSDWVSLLTQHTYYLLPLVLDAVSHMESSFVDWFLSHNNLIECNLGPGAKDDVANMKKWVLGHDLPQDRTTHWWYKDLPDSPKQAFDNVTSAKALTEAFRKRFPEKTYDLEVLDGMNEVYVACNSHNNNSDTVFYMKHIDGPYGIYPFCYVYRVLVAMSPNDLICTECVMKPQTTTLTTGDVLGFDFNREIHLIKHNPGSENEEPRIVLKVHFVVYPRALKLYGRMLGYLTTRYDINARNLFLNTIAPKSFFWKMMAKQVIVSTNLYFRIQCYLGINNLAYVFACGVVSYLCSSYTVFLGATSFVHYCIYMSTYYHRSLGVEGINYGEFKRNAMFHKGIAMSQAFSWYAYHTFQAGFDPISIAMIVLGFGLAGAASTALGWDRTYFGWELGFLPPKYITAWPYGPNGVPHPMIVGGIIGWLGIHKLAAMRAAFPYLVPCHVVLYLVHLTQEHFAIYSTGKLQSESKEA